MYKTLKYERDLDISIYLKKNSQIVLSSFYISLFDEQSSLPFQAFAGCIPFSPRSLSLSVVVCPEQNARFDDDDDDTPTKRRESNSDDDDETINHRRRRRRRRTKKKRRTRRRRWCFDEMVGRDEHRPQASDRALVRHRVSARELGVRT